MLHIFDLKFCLLPKKSKNIQGALFKMTQLTSSSCRPIVTIFNHWMEHGKNKIFICVSKSVLKLSTVNSSLHALYMHSFPQNAFKIHPSKDSFSGTVKYSGWLC